VAKIPLWATVHSLPEMTVQQAAWLKNPLSDIRELNPWRKNDSVLIRGGRDRVLRDFCAASRWSFIHTTKSWKIVESLDDRGTAV
jgi:hypothetical protein